MLHPKVDNAPIPSNRIGSPPPPQPSHQSLLISLVLFHSGQRLTATAIRQDRAERSIAMHWDHSMVRPIFRGHWKPLKAMMKRHKKPFLQACVSLQVEFTQFSLHSILQTKSCVTIQGRITAPVAMQKKVNSHNSSQLTQRISSNVSTQKEYVIIWEFFQNVSLPPLFGILTIFNVLFCSSWKFWGDFKVL